MPFDSHKLRSWLAALVVGAMVIAAPTPHAMAQEHQAAQTSATSASQKLALHNRTYEDPTSVPGKTVFSAEDEKFLDDLQRRGIQFFMDEQHPETGLMPDRSRAAGGASNNVASIASVGFGLTSMCIGVERGWVKRDDAYERSLRVLKFLRDKAPQEHGHFYHFLDMGTGKRVWNCEVSNIDTAILMAGVLTVRQYFPDTELSALANELYERVEWPWLMKENHLLSMGFKPESGFLEAEWSGYSEGPVLITLLGMGSKTHPLPPATWGAWKRDRVITYDGLTFIACPPLFTHQYPQCWFDLRGQRDDQANYFRNGQLATIAQRQWTIDELSKRYKSYNQNIWGLTASDYKGGYTAWGGPPAQGPIDGTVVPAAAAGSLAFTPRICIDALKAMREQYGEKGYVKYGFVDAFNPGTGWYNADVIGIDLGPSVLMAENARSAFVWKLFMSSPEAKAALKAADFRPLAPDNEEDNSPVNSVFTGKKER
ncbi:glucoamylase family protein [soil metagenome]